MGGNDQQVNIIAGMDLTRKKSGGQCYGITFPLLLNAQGQKFGKSESGAVYLSPERTSVYKFYQFWINVDDKDLEKLFKLFTFRELDEIKALLDEHAKAPHLRRAQKELPRRRSRVPRARRKRRALRRGQHQRRLAGSPRHALG